MVIYGLRDPITNEVRYVGATKNMIEERLKSHIKYAKNEKHTSYLCRWIRKLLRLNIIPIPFIIEYTTKESWAIKEKYWIRQLKNDSCRLVNWTEGGTGGDTRQGRSGKKHTQETKDLISKSKKNPSKETRDKISRANKNRRNFKEIMIKITEKARIGSMVKKRKLSDNQVESIRFRHKNGESISKMAAEYNVTRQTIHFTLKNKLKYLEEKLKNDSIT
jgi:hypothetical protein